MKYLKTYESQTLTEYSIIEDEPQKGDYVICRDSREGIWDFTDNNIGQIIDLNNNDYDYVDRYKYIVEYENVPKQLRNEYFHESQTAMAREEIIFYSSNKEDCEAFIATKKYNL